MVFINNTRLHLLVSYDIDSRNIRRTGKRLTVDEMCFMKQETLYDLCLYCKPIFLYWGNVLYKDYIGTRNWNTVLHLDLLAGRKWCSVEDCFSYWSLRFFSLTGIMGRTICMVSNTQKNYSGSEERYRLATSDMCRIILYPNNAFRYRPYISSSSMTHFN
jgi:hypothetical protein